MEGYGLSLSVSYHHYTKKSHNICDKGQREFPFGKGPQNEALVLPGQGPEAKKVGQVKEKVPSTGTP